MHDGQVRALPGDGEMRAGELPGAAELRPARAARSRVATDAGAVGPGPQGVQMLILYVLCIIYVNVICRCMYRIYFICMLYLYSCILCNAYAYMIDACT